MKKMNYKGRCEKRKVSKCDSIVRTYSKLQSSTVDSLEHDLLAYKMVVSVLRIWFHIPCRIDRRFALRESDSAISWQTEIRTIFADRPYPPAECRIQ